MFSHINFRLVEEDTTRKTNEFYQRLSLWNGDMSNLSNILQEMSEYYTSDKDDMAWYYKKTKYNEKIGYVLPSVLMLEQIKAFQHKIGIPICDFGTGSGLMTHLLSLMSCQIYGVDLVSNEKAGKFCNEKVQLFEFKDFQVPTNSILLMSWGLCYNVINEFVTNGGKYAIIIGEEEGGCTYPGWNYFDDNDEWSIDSVYKIPNFPYAKTRLSFNFKKLKL